MKKILAALFLTLGLCLNASALAEWLSVKVFNTDHATYKLTSTSQWSPMTNGVEYGIYPGASISVTQDSCVISSTSPKPLVVLTLHREGGNGFIALFTDKKELGSGLGLTVTAFESWNFDNCWLRIDGTTPCHSYDPTAPTFEPPPRPPSVPEDAGGPDPDWSMQADNESFPDTLVVGTQSSFPNYPDDTDVFVHVQLIAYNDDVDFETFEIGYDAVLGADEGPYDTGLSNTDQTWVRSRFEHEDGTPISDWGVTEVVNPIP